MQESSLSQNVRSVALSGIRQYTALAKSTPDCIALTIGEPEFDTPSSIRQAAKDALDSNMTHYPPNNGEPFLREAIARFENERNGYDYTADEVVVTVGATGAIFASLMSIINTGDEVIVPTPAFSLYENIIRLCGGKYVPLDTSKDDFQITSEALKAAISPRTKAIVLNSPNNPTGCILNAESLKNVYDLVKDTEIFVLCDDVYSQLVYDEGYRSFASFRDLRKQILLIQSFSKPYSMTGWRVGYLCGDVSVIAQIQKIHQNSAVSVTSFIQTACVQALKTNVTPMRESYHARRDYMYDALIKIGMEVSLPGGAFYIFPSIGKFEMDSDTFARRLIAECKVGTVPASCFGSEGFVRLSYCYSMEELEIALGRMERFIKSL